MKIIQRVWDDITHGENIDLYLTVIAAFGLIILNLLQIDVSEWISSITLAILGLLSLSLLGSRRHMEDQLAKLTTSSHSGLKGRTDLPSLETCGKNASEIVIVGVSSVTVVTRNLDFFEQKMKEGCILRFILLDPSSPALKTWDLSSKVAHTKKDIQVSLSSLKLLVELQNSTKGKCEIRLSKVFLPFGIAAFDPAKSSGFISVEFFIYKEALGNRPHIQLFRSKEEEWFEFFRRQYERLWSDSTEWNSVSIGSKSELSKSH